jgi:hypothetical protein
MLQHGNSNGHHKGTHVLQHEMGIHHLGHGLPHLVHNFDGAEHEYSGHGQGDVYGAGGTNGGAFTKRYFTDETNPPVNAEITRSERTDKQKFITTGFPQYIEYFHDPGLTKAIVVSG